MGKFLLGLIMRRVHDGGGEATVMSLEVEVGKLLLVYRQNNGGEIRCFVI